MRLAAVLSSLALVTFAHAAAAEGVKHCFTGAEMTNWRAADTRTVYLRMSGDRIYRVDLARECRTLRDFDARLVLAIRGGHTACSAVDLGLRASDGSFVEPCFVKSLSELAPAEANALPAKLKP